MRDIVRAAERDDTADRDRRASGECHTPATGGGDPTAHFPSVDLHTSASYSSYDLS